MKVLVVVDMQKDFIDGALGTPEAQAIVPKVINKIKQYAADENSYIIFTKDTHFQDYLESAEGKKLPVPHCIVHTGGWKIPIELIEAAGCVDINVLNKFTFGYYELPLDILEKASNREDEIESIEIVGLCTDVCVISNAMILKSCFMVAPIVVDSSCCAGVTPESHQNALNAMKMCQIDII